MGTIGVYAAYFLTFCASNTGCASRAGFVYGFFMSDPQQHLRLNTPSVEGAITSTSQRQLGFTQR
jgi:hypothetical protein